LMTVSENGLGKITEISEYREQWRGGKGVKVGAVTGKTGDIIGMSLLSEAQRLEGEVLLISKSWQTIRIPLKDVRVTSRVTQGVIFAKLKDKGDVFTSATVMKDSWEDEIDLALPLDEE
jgi:DNA gyrase subunit A